MLKRYLVTFFITQIIFYKFLIKENKNKKQQKI